MWKIKVFKHHLPPYSMSMANKETSQAMPKDLVLLSGGLSFSGGTKLIQIPSRHLFPNAALKYNLSSPIISKNYRSQKSANRPLFCIPLTRVKRYCKYLPTSAIPGCYPHLTSKYCFFSACFQGNKETSQAMPKDLVLLSGGLSFSGGT
ncbi:hypothetical protein CEXT_129621 [Caerostris extrusa]|uniref:Uncharacterized protein n=1 Tax=Caerostris extrusa TaxID=172846 RepID=A0AAV4N337_CAEEX|nr:hypothetical protein CEXT_129621 [Caerostris extrusa]